MDIYTTLAVPQFTCHRNCWTCSRIDVPALDTGEICSVRKEALAVYCVVSSCASPPSTAPLTDLWSAIESWGTTWFWDNLKIRGDISWLAKSIADNSLVAVTNGLYMKDMHPTLNSAAFKGRGRLWGSFVEHNIDAGSYRGELPGLMAIHLILKAINVVSPNLRGLVRILSDCLGALKKVEDLPPYRIPTQCSHSDILKNIMANCSNLSFTLTFSHVKAHQDDKTQYGDLPREAQLNCQMDFHAKTTIYEYPLALQDRTRHFPLEPLCVMIGPNKITLDKGDRLRFWIHKQLARSSLHQRNIILSHQFNRIDWEMVHITLRRVPRMFQIWACKQVSDIAPANGNRPWECSLCPLCPSCAQVPETCAHILFCNHSGRVDTLMKSINLLTTWLTAVDTDPDLRACIVEYAKGWGGVTMEEICRHMDSCFC